MPPADYELARSKAFDELTQHDNAIYAATVDGRPYFPTLSVDTSDDTSIKLAAAYIVLQSRLSGGQEDDDECTSELEEIGKDLANKILTVKVVSGGITNALFRVSGFESCRHAGLGLGHSMDFDSVLVRVFGAEGMIDRDIETSTYGALCDSQIAYRYLGRFANGRIEGWLDGYKALHKDDFADAHISNAIAVQMAHLHNSFVLPGYLTQYHDPSKPGMWTQLHSWMEQAKKVKKFQTPRDDERCKALNLEQIEWEMVYLEKEVVPPNARVAFCHNDLLAANIMVLADCEGEKKDQEDRFIQLIDFEYGGMNYVAFDVANHFNEHAGGTDAVDNGVPNYDLFPSKERQKEFITTYVHAAREGRGTTEETGNSETSVGEEVHLLMEEVHAFVMANHLYWGLWGVNQAAMEGCEDFDYLLYAANRFKQYFKCKEECES